tara:strand:- start:20260 stop:22299 length:2040 start_codon:yes stop_codon:yes gene_type:complete
MVLLKRSIVFIFTYMFYCLNMGYAQEKTLNTDWKLGVEGDIYWELAGDRPVQHSDHMAMSGQSVDMILEWGLDKSGSFHAQRLIRWPMLRTIPDDTHASLQRRLGDTISSQPIINGKVLSLGIAKRISIKGMLSVESKHQEGILSKRTIFPSVLNPAIIDRMELTNVGDETVEIIIPSWNRTELTEANQGVYGVYSINEFNVGQGNFKIAKGETLEYAIVRTARMLQDAPYFGNFLTELAGRNKFIENTGNNLILQSPDHVLNRLFAFAKIRASESIFSTRGGLMHSPGGYNKYLASFWANDQAEYIYPFFPFLGDVAGTESAINSFRHFSTYVNSDYKPIPSAIIAEGRSFWHGVGDRGDMAMLAYGASRFVLASGNKQYGEELWPFITWCLEYLKRKQLPNGSVASNTDELEGRFPTGEANLSTISQNYDALLSSISLGKELGKSEDTIAQYSKQAAALKKAIKRNFEANVEGFETYQYFEGNTKLRSWSSIPLTVGIYDRAEGTVDALFSPKLWTDNGLLTQSGTTTVWDRSALVAFRGIFKAGYADKGLERLRSFSKTRLLGDHVPYLIEAFPEYNMSHLSAEGGLYCRIFIEGLFGIRPTGFSRFDCKPSLPTSWDNASLKNIRAFGMTWSIEFVRKGKLITVIITDGSGKTIYDHSLPEGKTHQIDLEKLIRS